MANDVEIRVTSKDTSGPALLVAASRTKSLREEVTRAAASMRAYARDTGRASDSLLSLATASLAANRGLAGVSNAALGAGHHVGRLGDDVTQLAQSLDEVGAKRVEPEVKVDVDKSKADVDAAAKQIGGKFGKALGDFAGPEAVAALSARLSAAGATMSGPAAAVGAPLAAGIAVWLGGTIAGAITGGVGAGGVIGGLAAVRGHSAVKQSATALGDEFRTTLQQAAVSFVPAAVQGVGVLRSHLGKARGDLESIFSSASKFVVPLAEGAGQAAREVLRGVRDVAEQAGPAVDSIANGIVRLGRGIGDGLSSISDNAASGGRALDIFFGVIDIGTRTVFGFINVLAEAWEILEIGSAMLGGNIARLGELVVKTGEGEQANAGFAQSLDEIIAGFGGESEAAEEAARATKAYADALDRIVDQNLSAAEANLRYRESLTAAKEAVEKKGKVTRDEENALLSLARASNSLTDALEEQGASAERLSAHEQRAHADFVRTAEAMGYSTARARELADQYLKIPRRVETDIEADVDQAARNLRTIRTLISQIKSKRVVITTQHNQIVTRSEGRNVPIGDGVGGRAHGGITGAQSGGIRSNLTLVGEAGPELLELPPSTTVHPAGTTQRMLSGAGGPLRVELILSTDGRDATLDAILPRLRYRVRTDGAEATLGVRAEVA